MTTFQRCPGGTDENFTLSRFPPIRRIQEILRLRQLPSLPFVIWIAAYVDEDKRGRKNKARVETGSDSESESWINLAENQVNMIPTDFAHLLPQLDRRRKLIECVFRALFSPLLFVLSHFRHTFNVLCVLTIFHITHPLTLIVRCEKDSLMTTSVGPLFFRVPTTCFA